MIANKQNKSTSSSTIILRVACALATVTMMVVQPPAAGAAPYPKPWMSDEWPAKVEIVTSVAPVTTNTGRSRQIGQIPDHGLPVVTDAKEAPCRHGCDGRKHGVGRKHGKHGLHGRGRKHGKRGGGRPRKSKPKRGHRKEYIVDRKLVIVNIIEDRTLSNGPISSTPPEVTMVSETVVKTHGRTVDVKNQLLHSIGITNAVWLVVLIFWTAVMVFLHRRGRWSGRKRRLGVTELSNELETAIELNPIVGLKALTELKSENDLRPLIKSETASKLNSSV